MDLEQAFADLADQLLVHHPRLQRGRMFGSPTLPTGGKVFAMVVKGRLVAKLPHDQVSRLLASGDGEPFDPGHGRVMRQWVSLRPADPATLARLVDRARTYVAAGARA